MKETYTKLARNASASARASSEGFQLERQSVPSGPPIDNMLRGGGGLRSVVFLDLKRSRDLVICSSAHGICQW